MAMAILCIMLFGALCAKLGMPVWLVLVLGVFLTAVSAEIRDPYRKLKKQELAESNCVPARH
jgi:hypothetical protein